MEKTLEDIRWILQSFLSKNTLKYMADPWGNNAF